jgi:hypothetical protein
MVAWPLYVEQKMNAAMLEVQAGVVVRVHALGHFQPEPVTGWKSSVPACFILLEMLLQLKFDGVLS